MTSREKIQTAMNHQDGPVPLDLGGGPTTGIHCSVVESLRDHYGLEKHPVTVCEPYQMLGLVEDDLKDAMGVDTQAVWTPYTMFGFRNEDWKEFRTPWGQVVLVPGRFEYDRTEEGDVLLYPKGNKSVPPCARMPESSFFFDATARQGEIDDDALNPEDNLEEFGPISEEDLERWEELVARYAGIDRYRFGNLGGTAFGDIALVPGLNLEHPKGIRDVTEWYISTVTRQDYLHAIFDRQADIAVSNLQKIHERIGEGVDLAYICGTDFGTQSSTFLSKETYDELYKPYYLRVNNWIHANTTWKTFKHSCGAVFDLIPNFIESGFDAINPVQISAAGMDARKLKDSYGRDIVFWGGAVDTQKTLPFGTPEEVRKETLGHLRIFAPGGGFVASSVHNIQAKTPVENVVAMLDALREYNAS